MLNSLNRFSCLLALVILGLANTVVKAQTAKEPIVRVFIFAGQSNMVGSDSRAADVKNFPPFDGLDQPQPEVQFSYCIGREQKRLSQGWQTLQPVNEIIGPELSFARKVAQHTTDPIAIIKIAAGGTHLGGDWNPDEPSGFELYPLALQHIRDALSALDKAGKKYQLEGFMWHQGENDMFVETYKQNYGPNLKNFLAAWRRDLNQPDLKFFIGELCTKTIWGMDLRPRMYAISLGQKMVTDTDPLATFVPTSHVGVEIGGRGGLHYHYGTLGQLEHGENYADAWMKSEQIPFEAAAPKLDQWPYANKTKVKLFVLAGHRNMEGERAFVQDLEKHDHAKNLITPNQNIAFRYSIGGGYQTSQDWLPLAPAGFYQTFGPELSFGAALSNADVGQIAIAKFTHSGSQIVDWTPAGSMAVSRNLYPSFIEFIKTSIAELESRGNQVELAGVFYHLGENDMSFGPFRVKAASHVGAMIQQSRLDLDHPNLKWFVSQQPPTDHESVNKINVVQEVSNLAASDANVTYIQAFDLVGSERELVISTLGIVQLGKIMAKSYSNQE